MGICASIQLTKTQGRLLITNGPSSTTTKVINAVDGNLQEFRKPIKADQVLSDHPNTFFLCNSETMFVNSPVPHVPGDEELQPGQIYFLMPIWKSNTPLSLEDLCLLAIKTSKALGRCTKTRTNDRTASSSDRRKSSKSNRNARTNQKVDFQLALKKLE